LRAAAPDIKRIDSLFLEKFFLISERPAANSDMEAGREGAVSGRGGANRTRAYITYPKKFCLADFVTIERILR
jgi:hypothetical protein